MRFRELKRRGSQRRPAILLAGSMIATTTFVIAVPVQIQAQPRAVVTGIWRDGPVKITELGDLCVKSADDLAERALLEVNEGLAPGDILSSGPCSSQAGLESEIEPGLDAIEDLSLELTCAGSTGFKFSGDFRVLILEPEAERCAIDLLRGTVDVLTDQPAEITSGGFTIGVEGTRLTVVRGHSTAAANQGQASLSEQLSCLLFDGQARIYLGETAEASAWTFVLEPGERWSKVGERIVRDSIVDKDLVAAAERSARLDVARAHILGTLPQSSGHGDSEVFQELAMLYFLAFYDPENRGQRAALARALLGYGLVDRARTELRHADIEPGDVELLRRLDIDPDQLTSPTGDERLPSTPESPELKPRLPEPAPMVKVPLAAELGIVMVTLPWDLRKGETISGSLTVSGSGDGPSKAKKNLRRLSERFHVTIGTAKIPILDGSWTVRLPVEGEAFEVALRNRRGKLQKGKSIDFAAAGNPGATATLTAPAFCRSGTIAAIRGSFDGDTRSTQVLLGDEPLPALGETTTKVLIDCPAAAGLEPLTVVEGEQRLEVPSFRTIELDFNVLKSPLARGEVSNAILNLRGLEGLDHPVAVWIRNRDPSIVRLQGGDEQILTFRVDDWDAEGSLTRTFQVVGRRSGKTAFDVELQLISGAGQN